MVIYKLFWDEFSSWYLEWIKPAYGEGIDEVTYKETLSFFDAMLKLLHPFMPFITEELWQNLEERKEGDSLMVDLLPKAEASKEELLNQVELVKELISHIRSVRLQKNIANKDAIILEVIGENPYAKYQKLVEKLCNLEQINEVDVQSEGAVTFMVATTEFAIPLGNLIDVDAEIERMEAELKHKEGFLKGVLKKLSNERFVQNAPAAVIELERKKQADTESIIASLQESIKSLKASK